MKMMLVAFVVLILFDVPLYSMNEDGDWKQNWSSDSNLSDMSDLSNIINGNNTDESSIFSDSDMPVPNYFCQSPFQPLGGGSEEEVPESSWSYIYGAVSNILSSPKLEPFDGLIAEGLLGNYHELYQYLQKYIDIPGKEEVHKWIEARASQEGNVVCLYLSVRNSLKYCSSDSQDSFTKILLLLMRVAYDTVNHYAIFKDPSVLGKFGAYYMLKQKVHWMLGYYMPKTSYLFYPQIADATTFAFEHWKKFFKNNCRVQRPSCVWLRSFQWSHGWTPTIISWGIFFGPDVVIDIEKFESGKINLSPLNTFAIIENIFTCRRTSVFDEIDENFIPNRYSNWVEFFQSFDFPLTAEKLTQKLKPPIYGDL